MRVRLRVPACLPAVSHLWKGNQALVLQCGTQSRDSDRPTGHTAPLKPAGRFTKRVRCWNPVTRLHSPHFPQLDTTQSTGEAVAGGVGAGVGAVVRHTCTSLRWRQLSPPLRGATSTVRVRRFVKGEPAHLDHLVHVESLQATAHFVVSTSLQGRPVCTLPVPNRFRTRLRVPELGSQADQ